MQQISSLKVLSPIDMHAIFYQKCWNMVGKNKCHTIIAFLKHGHLLRELNKMHITLIPKTDNSKKVND